MECGVMFLESLAGRASFLILIHSPLGLSLLSPEDGKIMQ